MFARGYSVWLMLVWIVVTTPVPAAAQESGTAAVSVPASVPASVPVPASASASVPVPASASASVPASESVLLAPVQGSEALRVQLGERVLAAVRRALGARGYQHAASQELLGQAVVACQTPECVEQALDAAGAAFAIVPAIWVRESGGEELTLTLVQKSGRSLNATGAVGDDLSGTSADLVDELLAQGAAVSAPAHPHAWKAGPIILIAGGTAAFVAVGVAAGIRNDTQQLNTGAAAAWAMVGATAIAGGIAWWVVGQKRRRQGAGSAGAPVPTIAFHPTGIDLRLRF
ncbi:MAG: hypothetical protein JRD92_11305 [Deltaproteobacteria bacterium]|nr:hypothetical protein [Deltaproteobacteria bacterium]